jgi:hypothetical protein
MWTLILLIALVAALAFWISRKIRKPFPSHAGKPVDPPSDTYVCDVCGEEGCTCHKEKTPNG